eukprot:3581974-Pleurochrysis_carterae.AAC.1
MLMPTSANLRTQCAKVCDKAAHRSATNVEMRCGWNSAHSLAYGTTLEIASDVVSHRPEIASPCALDVLLTLSPNPFE